MARIWRRRLARHTDTTAVINTVGFGHAGFSDYGWSDDPAGWLAFAAIAEPAPGIQVCKFGHEEPLPRVAAAADVPCAVN